MTSVKIAILVIFLSGCTSYGRPIELPIPVKPVIEVLKYLNYECLTIDQWSNLRDRAILRDGYERELIEILKSTRQ